MRLEADENLQQREEAVTMTCTGRLAIGFPGAMRTSCDAAAEGYD
jgi:hypothetical protein